MKKALCFVIFIITFCLICPSIPAASPVETPEASIERVMSGIKNYTVTDITSSDNLISEIRDMAVKQVLSRLDYELGNSKITGNRAVVDISVTAADIKKPLESAVSQVISYTVLQKLFSLPVSAEEFALERLSEILDEDNLTTIRTDTSVYLALGGDGRWSLDLSHPGNLDFLEAISGGIADFEAVTRLIRAEA